MSENGPDQQDLPTDLSDTDFVQHLLAELHDDLEVTCPPEVPSP